MDEAKIEDALKQWAKPDPDFREDLLQRCLAVLDQEDQEDSMELDDSELDMLAAAGDVYSGIGPYGDDAYRPYSTLV